MFSKAVAACLLAFAVAVRVTEDLDSHGTGYSTFVKNAETPATEDSELDCERLKNIIYCENPAPVKMGRGTYAQTWLVKAKVTGSLEVLKTFFVPKEFGQEAEPDRLATASDLLRPSTKLRKVLHEVSLECHQAQHLHSAGLGKEGSKYVMSCLDSNVGKDPSEIDSQDLTPLYSMVSYCGSEDLRGFVARIVKEDPANALDIFRQIFKQIVLGVNFLATASKDEIVHHDLKPGNIMVKTSKGPDGKLHYRAYLIDLGSMSVGVRDVCRMTGSSVEYAPAEWGKETDKCPGGMLNFDPKAPWAFDVFSLAIIYIELLTGYRTVMLANKVKELWCVYLNTVWCSDAEIDPSIAKDQQVKFNPKQCKEAKDQYCPDHPQNHHSVYTQTPNEVHHNILDHTVSDQRFFIGTMGTLMQYWRNDADPHLKLYQDAVNNNNNDGTSFMIMMLAALKSAPLDRPHTYHMLKHAWLKSVHLDLFDVEEAEVAETVMQQVVEERSSS